MTPPEMAAAEAGRSIDGVWYNRSMGWTTHTYDPEPCPCGAGTVVLTCRESDNGYSGDDWSIDVNCSVCTELKVKVEAGPGGPVFTVGQRQYPKR